MATIRDPERRGETLAEFFRAAAPRLYADLAESGVLPAGGDRAARARAEWECFALYACVRGLIAAGGFNRETAAAIDALHERALGAGDQDSAATGELAARRTRIAERYAEYGAIGQSGGAAGAATVTRRLGDAAARHLAGSDPPPAELAELVAELHETLAEAAAEAVRRAE